MKPSLASSLTADVRITDSFEQVVVTPRRHDDCHLLVRLIRELLGGTNVRLSSEGVRIPAWIAGLLLNASANLDLRMSSEARLFLENRQRVTKSHPALHAQVKRIRSEGRREADKYLDDVTGLDALDDHQRVNVAAMTLPDGYGLSVFDEQGAGKTVTLIFGYDVLVSRDEVDFALIVAPKSMVGEWPGDFEKFKGDLYKVEMATGSYREKRRALRSEPDVIITNFETAVSMEQELRAMLRRYQGRAILVVDESFYIKSLDAKRTKALRRLREFCGRAFVLCGTPAPNSPHDLVQQFSIVDFGFTFATATIPKDREEARPIVQSAIDASGLFVRHLKSDVLPGLPIKRFNRVLLEMQPVQESVYRDALAGLIKDLETVDAETFQRELVSFLAKRTALLQICSHPGAVVKNYMEVPGKLHALDGLLKDLIVSQGEKVIVWSFYTSSIDAIFQRYVEFNPVRYDGQVTDVAERQRAVRNFQDDDKTMLFVGNPAAAGAGLTLHRARLAIYESMSNQAAHYLQSLDRIHRRGQTRDVDYLVLLCKDSIEIGEYERLLRKERAAQALLGDKVTEPVTREGLLDEARRALHLLNEPRK